MDRMGARLHPPGSTWLTPRICARAYIAAYGPSITVFRPKVEGYYLSLPGR